MVLGVFVLVITFFPAAIVLWNKKLEHQCLCKPIEPQEFSEAVPGVSDSGDSSSHGKNNEIHIERYRRVVTFLLHNVSSPFLNAHRRLILAYFFCSSCSFGCGRFIHIHP
eukprot:GABV01008270.1.p1 GENE.GABV01008270.1~~GABV01008270.1.p1  ORF type:complete len:110 (-),score=23.00 GABV01008270.1:37-366(-)